MTKSWLDEDFDDSDTATPPANMAVLVELIAGMAVSLDEISITLKAFLNTPKSPETVPDASEAESIPTE